jgi:hypothetical protein
MITTFRALICGLLLAVPLAAAVPRQPVAIIYHISGEALGIVPGRSPGPLRLFDRLPSESTLELAAGSRLALAFVTGKRYELSGPARVTLGRGDLAARSRGVRTLAPVPPLPSLSPIAEEDRPGSTAGAVRIRSEMITALYPRHGVVVLAAETYLRFQPVTGTMEYLIEVQDDQGQTVFRANAASPPVKVPAGRLRAGHHYEWTVRTQDRPGALARGEAELVTLSQGAARMRDEARRILTIEGPRSLPLLAEIDHGLGLLLEAREDLRMALDGEPANPALREALAEIEMQLEDADDHN